MKNLDSTSWYKFTDNSRKPDTKHETRNTKHENDGLSMPNSLSSLSKPMREFCAGGPVPKEGYYVLRDRPEIGEIIDKVKKGRYFVIYAPRQVGKTSLIQEVVQKLADDTEYLPLYLTFQDFGQK